MNIPTIAKQFFSFITLLRALAAIVITNSHYTGIYPTDMIANGGLLGDVMFFSVSGFCLASPTMSFLKWYPKRLWRIYAVVWVITLVYVLLGFYPIHTVTDGITTFLHPTKYHFIASITVLYVPLYFVAKHIQLNPKNFLLLSLGLLGVQLILYTTIYDTSFYHIDTVREPMIEFLFFQSMLLGLHFRWRGKQYGEANTGRKDIWLLMLLLFALGMYFVSKLFFVRYTVFSDWQILNQLVLYLCLFLMFLFAMGQERRIKKLEGTKIWSVIQFLSDHTLEIYLVQSVLIGLVRGMQLPFPLNWVLTTTAILLAAAVLRWSTQKIIRLVKL